ncbi:MAG: acyltransferase [Porphyromonas sp.]|nr:acyltransferase [Porphyromonas sp.]
MAGRNWRKITPKKLWNYLVIIHVKYFLWHFSAYFPLFQEFMCWRMRPFIWRLIGVNVGRRVFIGYGVYLDVDGASRITIGDNVLIAAQSLLLTHKRDLSNYNGQGLQNELGFHLGAIELRANSSIGMRTMILPGVTIGENTVIGACSLVAKDVPDNVLAVGNPLKVIKEFR